MTTYLYIYNVYIHMHWFIFNLQYRLIVLFLLSASFNSRVCWKILIFHI